MITTTTSLSCDVIVVRSVSEFKFANLMWGSDAKCNRIGPLKQPKKPFKYMHLKCIKTLIDL